MVWSGSELLIVAHKVMALVQVNCLLYLYSKNCLFFPLFLFHLPDSAATSTLYGPLQLSISLCCSRILFQTGYVIFLYDLSLQGASSQDVTAVLTEGTVPAYTVELLSGPQAHEMDALTASNNSGNSANHPYSARIDVLRELHTRKSDRSCLHVELDIQGSGLHYEAGDHVGKLVSWPVVFPYMLGATAAFMTLGSLLL